MISFDPKKKQNLIGYTWNNNIEPGFLFRLNKSKNNILLYAILEKIKWTILQPFMLVMTVPLAMLFVNNIVTLIAIPLSLSLLMLLFNIIITKKTSSDFGIYFYNDKVIFNDLKKKVAIKTNIFNELCEKQNIKPLYMSKEDISVWRVFEADDWPFTKSRFITLHSSIFDTTPKQEAKNMMIWNKKVNESFESYRYKKRLSEQIISNIDYKEFLNDVKKEFNKLIISNSGISKKFNRLISKFNNHVDTINTNYNKHKYDNIEEIMASREIEKKLDLDDVKNLCKENKLLIKKADCISNNSNDVFDNEKKYLVVRKKNKKSRLAWVIILMLMINIFLYAQLINIGKNFFIDFRYENIFMYLLSSYSCFIIVIILCKYFINNYNNIEIIFADNIIIKTKSGTVIVNNKIAKDALKLLNTNKGLSEFNLAIINIIDKIN